MAVLRAKNPKGHRQLSRLLKDFFMSTLAQKLEFWLRDLLAPGCRGLGEFRRCYHVHVRKTGGTSLNHMFLGWNGGNGAQRYEQLARAKKNRLRISRRVFVGWNRKLIEKGAYFYAFSHLPFYELQLPPGTMIVTCFRDPVRRLFSHYRMLKQYQLNQIAHPCMEVEGAWLGDDFGHFLKNVPQEHALCQLYMFSANFDVGEALERVRQIHHVLFTERMAEGVKEINRVTGLSLQPLHARENKLLEKLEPRWESLAREILAREYDFLEKVKGLGF